MLKPAFIIFFLVISSVKSTSCQEVDNGPGFQLITHRNPAFSGSEGDGILRLSYLNYFPGNNYNLHSVYFSYDSYFPSLHGGAGIYLSNDYAGGIMNDIRGGFSYSYYLQAGKDFFINGGLSASLYHRGYNFSGAILPDQIDQLGAAVLTSGETLSEEGHTAFDIDAGFLAIYKSFFCGVAINHLAEPRISGKGFPDDNLKRKIILHASGDLYLGHNDELVLRPQLFSSVQNGLLTIGGGSVFETKHLSFNAMMFGNNENTVNIQTGFAIRSDRLSIFYNYRFNVVSANSMMPLSLLHQTGLAFSLNNVDKRNIIKTINFPKM